MFDIISITLICFFIGWLAGALIGILFTMFSEGIEINNIETFAIICAVSNAIYGFVHTLFILN